MSKKQDEQRKAKPAGYRFKGENNFKRPLKSERGDSEVYYEARKNRADKNLKKQLKEGGKITSYRDIPYNEVLEYADEKGLSTATEGDLDEVRQMLFEEKYAKDRKDGGKVGGRGFFGLHKGEKIKSNKDISVGDVIMSHSNQFNSDNVLKITDRRVYGDLVALDAIYWNPKEIKRIGNEDLSVDVEFGKIGNTNEYYKPKEILEEGGSILDNYKDKNPENLWNEWTTEQRTHFLRDHYFPHFHEAKTGEEQDKVYSYHELEYDKLPYHVKDKIQGHLFAGQYKHGGKVNGFVDFLNTTYSFSDLFK